MFNPFSKLTAETKYELYGIMLITVSIVSFISLQGVSSGAVGVFFAKILHYALGVGALMVPILLGIIGSRYIWTRHGINYSVKFISFMFLFIVLLALYHHFVIDPGKEILPESLVKGGGLVGGFFLFGLRKLFGYDGTLVLLLGSAVASFVLATNWSLSKTLITAKTKAGDGIQSARDSLSEVIEQRQTESVKSSPHSFYNQEKDQTEVREQEAAVEATQPICGLDEITAPLETAAVAAHAPISPPTTRTAATTSTSQTYHLPPLSLLNKPVKPKSKQATREITENAHILEQTLESFHVSAKIVHTCQGPAVTRYELEPAAGVKVSRIVNLSDDIALKLAAPGVRIEAPIPGKAAIGIEVPNKVVSSVPHREVLESEAFQHASSQLTVALGKDIAGQTIVTDLAKMPHLLVAGATGSGKSVCINTLITSILFKSSPDEAKFILIDPKVVELSNYNGIPHLLTPVVTDAKKAAAALRWAVHEMERRYGLFAAASVRDINRYNEIAAGEKLPLIVIIIDELADLMMVAPVDVEDAVCRLAQMARAAGLHLVLATQRPSVDVITGTIKANIPSRISFAVSSQIDSRTILDMAGAEKLLGKGDMLFYPVGAAKPLRVQGSFISDDEVAELVHFVSQEAEPEFTEGVTDIPENQEQTEQPLFEDELLPEAVRLVLETGQASASMLQRKFRIGYSRAARLVDTMEEMKIVGPSAGSKAREIIMTSAEVYERYFHEN